MATHLFSSIQASDLFSKFKPDSRFWKILNFPLMRIIVIVLFLVPIMAINGVVRCGESRKNRRAALEKAGAALSCGFPDLQRSE
jgi:hypothetical protein